MALSIIVRGGDAWIAENTHVIRKINLEVLVSVVHGSAVSDVGLVGEDSAVIPWAYRTRYIYRLHGQALWERRQEDSNQWIMGSGPIHIAHHDRIPLTPVSRQSNCGM